MAMKLGYFVDKQGDPVMTASFEEAMFKVAGFTGEGVTDLYELQQKLPGESTGGGKRSKNDSLKEISREYFRRIKNVVSMDVLNTPDSLDALQLRIMNDTIAAEAVIFEYLEPDEADYVKLEFRKLVAADKLTDKGDDIISKIADAAIQGHYGNDIEYYVNRLKQAKIIKTPQQEKDVAAIIKYITEEKANGE